jgi:hypothetical protein
MTSRASAHFIASRPTVARSQALKDRWQVLRATAALAAAGALAFLVAVNVSSPSTVAVIGVVIGLPLLVYCFVSPRIDLSVAALLLYVGLLDGFIRMKTGHLNLTLLRDVLLYAIAAGALARTMNNREGLTLPPFSGWVVAFTVVVVVQLANPGSGTIAHMFAALRPHIEWVPLFFLGYAVLRTEKRLRIFLALLVVVAAANGIVSLVQFNLSPEQLSAWGPGYQVRIAGTGDVAARVFVTEGRQALVRPFGLGSDSGFGGSIGLLALAPGIALMTLARRHTSGKVAVLLCWGPLLGIVTSQGRTIIIASIVTLLSYVALTTAARRLVPTLAAVLFVGVIAVFGVSAFSGGSQTGAWERYQTITPTKLLDTADSSRGRSINRIPELAVSYPFGGGLGSLGPAAKISGGGRGVGLDGETQFSFLISELGIAGLVILIGFHLKLLLLCATRVRSYVRPEARTLLAAVAASLAGMSATWLSGPASSASPWAPFFWLVAGALAWWLVEERRSDSQTSHSRPTPLR